MRLDPMQCFVKKNIWPAGSYANEVAVLLLGLPIIRQNLSQDANIFNLFACMQIESLRSEISQIEILLQDVQNTWNSDDDVVNRILLTEQLGRY